MLSRLRSIAESYLFILAISLVIGLFVPQARILVAWNIFLLQAIFFFSSLKMNGSEILTHLKDWRTVAASGIFMLILLPLAVRGVTFLLPESLAAFGFAFFLLAAMPSGMTSPLLAEHVGGNEPLALVITAGTSLLAPFLVPLMLWFAYGATVQVNALGMMWTLVLVIFVPFVLAMFVKRIAPKPVGRMTQHTKPISTILLGLLIAGAISPHATRIIHEMETDIVRTVLLFGAIVAFFIILHILGFLAVWWKAKRDRQTVAVCLTYMNFTLAIFLASTYFPDPDIVLPLVLCIIPWATMLPLWKRVSARMT